MSKSITMDKEKVSLNLARLKKGGGNFEIVIDSDAAIKFKEGDDVDIKDILKSEKIFSDAKKGLLASEDRMKVVFETDDVLDIAKKIISEGEIQLTAQYRDSLRLAKRKRVLDIIHTNGVDPKTNLPHPMVRLENAFEEAKIKIDDYKKAKDQVNDIVKKLQPILPIKFEIVTIEIIVPASFAGKAYPAVASIAKIESQDWLNDGSWKGVVKVPAGLQNELFDTLNNLTHGDVETKVLK